MLRLQNKFHLRTKQTHFVWITGWDSQCFFHHTKKWKPWQAEELKQEGPEPISKDSWLFSAAKWLGVSIAFGILLMVIINIGKMFWRG